MVKTRRAAVVVCLAVALCVALTPAPFLCAYAILVPLWLPSALVPVVGFFPTDDGSTKPAAPVFSVLVPRAPPV